MIRNKYNHIPHPTLDTKRERRIHTKFDQRPRKSRTVNRMNSSIARNPLNFNLLITSPEVLIDQNNFTGPFISFFAIPYDMGFDSSEARR